MKSLFRVSRFILIALSAPLAGCAATSVSPLETNATGVTLTKVATFDHQVTGVAVAKNGRTFVSFPRWSEDAPISVGEVASDGSVTPFPNAEWNRWRNSKKDDVAPQDHFICVQSVVVDPTGALWVVDPAAPSNGPVVPGGAKLVKFDLASNQPVLTIPLDDSIAPPTSYINDIRFSPDMKFAYCTDSGANGALLVVDLSTNKARRVLEGDPSTQIEKGVKVSTDGRPLIRTDGRPVAFSADGLAVSADGAFLYYQALTGHTLYRIATKALQDPSISSAELSKKIERVGDNRVADALWIDAKNRMFITSPEDDSVKMRSAPDQPLSVLVQSKSLRWPDSFAEGVNGSIFVTASHIQDSAWFVPQSSPQLKTELFRIDFQR